ncbi:hypothetical protein B0H14DRAFT_2604513 [Mycena olivaceomarginata]|nr:hypothetical protein B0H14DRAFT_2604513 [Mycena olivaceomarginata]
MGGSLLLCGPGQKPEDVDTNDESLCVYYRYSGFTDIKVIALRATIGFLTAVSAKQISKQLLVDEGLVAPEHVEGAEEAVVIANYRARIDTAIKLLKTWYRPDPPPPQRDPLLNMLGGVKPTGKLAELIAQRSLIAELMAEIPFDYDKINPQNLSWEKSMAAPPHTLSELRLAGIHAFILFPDSDAEMLYEQTKEVGRLLRMVRGYCEWDERTWGPPPPPEYQPPKVREPVSEDKRDEAMEDEEKDREEKADAEEDEDYEEEPFVDDEPHFIDKLIHLFGAVPPGGTART